MSYRLTSLAKARTLSVVHAHDLDFVFVIDRIIAADEQPKQAARQDTEDESEQRLLVKIVLDGGVVVNDQKAEDDEGNRKSPSFWIGALNKNTKKRYGDGD